MGSELQPDCIPTWELPEFHWHIGKGAFWGRIRRWDHPHNEEGTYKPEWAVKKKEQIILRVQEDTLGW